jgi:hypothetical protein
VIGVVLSKLRWRVVLLFLQHALEGCLLLYVVSVSPGGERCKPLLPLLISFPKFYTILQPDHTYTVIEVSTNIEMIPVQSTRIDHKSNGKPRSPI